MENWCIYIKKINKLCTIKEYFFMQKKGKISLCNVMSVSEFKVEFEKYFSC